MTPVLYLISASLGLTLVFLTTELFYNGKNAFLSGFTFKKALAILLEAALLFGFMYLVSANGHRMDDLYKGNFPLFLAITGVGVLLVTFYLYVGKKWLYYVFGGGGHITERVIIPISGNKKQEVTLLYTEMNQKRIVRIPFTDILVVGKNFRKGMDSDSQWQVQVAVAIYSHKQWKHMLLMACCFWLWVIVGSLGITYFEGGDFYPLFMVLWGASGVMIRDVLRSIRFSDLRDADRVTATIFGLDSYLRSLGSYYVQQTSSRHRYARAFMDREKSRRFAHVRKMVA
ncbi:hypothetical protein FKX85_03505 [Echinicola soli]|uniref:Uncharacterized protein n=1 Tax=Echinicola soli TaxID=2591634 RepID=A0A514CEB1_9BACT|nr:hypothetical protein [Echinicola soli]QDH78153.1 hypothetical protein FKX85_03505 [Echinicola soli]